MGGGVVEVSQGFIGRGEREREREREREEQLKREPTKVDASFFMHLKRERERERKVFLGCEVSQGFIGRRFYKVTQWRTTGGLPGSFTRFHRPQVSKSFTREDYRGITRKFHKVSQAASFTKFHKAGFHRVPQIYIYMIRG